GSGNLHVYINDDVLRRHLAQQPGGVVTARFPPAAPPARAGPTDEDVGKAVLKALLALASHQASKPQPGDGIIEAIARELARKARDELIESALQDVSPPAGRSSAPPCASWPCWRWTAGWTATATAW